jgi:general secretion pathway protein J
VVLSVHNRNGGFTLLEIIIAIAILAIVFSSLYAAYSSTLETTEQVESERDIEQAARLGLMRMADDLASVYVQEAENDSEDSPYRFVGGSSDSLDQGDTVVEFATSGHLDFDMIFPSLRINRVSYVLEKQAEEERSYRLVRREIPFAGLGGEEHKAEIEVADGVEQLTLTYVGEEGQIAGQWDSQAPETKGLAPRLVYIRLQMAEDKSRFFTTTVALPAISSEQSTPEGEK